MSTVVLISTANRGLGKGLPRRYLKLASHTLVAANRNPDHPTSFAAFKNDAAVVFIPESSIRGCQWS
jgi:NAD(P)-dependent dehydrogenase (short-subunit alcohol dehydrogenase family)